MVRSRQGTGGSLSYYVIKGCRFAFAAAAAVDGGLAAVRGVAAAGLADGRKVVGRNFVFAAAGVAPRAEHGRLAARAEQRGHARLLPAPRQAPVRRPTSARRRSARRESWSRPQRARQSGRRL